MTVNVNNFTGYVVDSSLVNPDLAVFLRNTTQYMVESPAVNAALAVFMLNSTVYEVSGKHSSAVVLENSKVYLISSHWHTAHLVVPATNAYVISGGRGANNRPSVSGTKLYMITS